MKSSGIIGDRIPFSICKGECDRFYHAITKNLSSSQESNESSLPDSLNVLAASRQDSKLTHIFPAWIISLVINMNKNRKNLFHLWMSIAADINNTLPNVPVLGCPSCHRLGIDFQFVGDFQTKIGYLAIWCSFCLHGIHISRVRIPDKTQALPFNTSTEEISRRVPNFTHIKPDDYK